MGEYHQLPQLFYACRRRLAGNVAAHSHGGCELIYLLRGSCRVEGVHGVLKGKAGHLLVIPPETVHNQIDSQDEKNIFCVFQAPPELFEQRWRTIDLAGENWCCRWLLELSKMTERHDLEGANAILLGLLQKLAAFEKKTCEHGISPSRSASSADVSLQQFLAQHLGSTNRRRKRHQCFINA